MHRDLQERLILYDLEVPRRNFRIDISLLAISRFLTAAPGVGAFFFKDRLRPIENKPYKAEMIVKGV